MSDPIQLVETAAIAAAPEGEVLPPERALARPTVRLIHIANPLMPSTSRTVVEREWSAGKTLETYLLTQFGSAEVIAGFVVSVNGGIVKPEIYGEYVPRAGDTIVVSPAVLGGSVWRTLAQVAVAAAAVTAAIVLPGIGGFATLAAFSGLTAGTAAGIVAGAISMVGGILINSFMANQPSSKAQSPSYAFGGPTSLAQSGTVIPKGYGKFQWGGNVISSFIDIEGQNQYINALVCFGFGPARAITNIEINGKSIAEYQNVAQYVRYGTNDQTEIGAFNRIVNGYPQEVQVTCAGGAVVVPGTGTQTQALQVDIEFATGVFYITGDGNQIPCSVSYQVMYSVTGANDWQPILQPKETRDVVYYNGDGTVNPYETPTWGLYWTGCAPGSGIVLDWDNGPHTPGDQQTHTEDISTYNADGSHTTYSQAFQGEWQPINTALNNLEVMTWMNGWVIFTDSTTEVDYNRTSVYGLAPNCYDIQVTKYGSAAAGYTITYGDYDSPHRGQEVWIHSVNEITYQDLAYPNMILVGIRALATNQLSGANINVTALIQHGLRSLDENILPAALQAYEEDNPACVAADMMLDTLYGGGQFPGILPTNIERFIDDWVNWAELNDELVNAQGNVTAIAITTAGADQTPGNYTVTLTGGGGNGAQAVIVVAAGGTVTAAPNLTNAGEGYGESFTFTFNGAGGTPSTFAVTVSTVSIRRHVFNCVVDNEDNLWNQVQMVGRMSRASVMPMGRDYGVYVDRADTPVQMFTMGNIVQDSFQETWLSLDDRANQIEVQFADSTRFYKQDNPIVWMSPADMASGAVVKNVRIDGKGVTIPAQAWHLGNFKGLCNELLLRTGQFKCDTDAIACRAGNVIILQHDVPQWGWGGRTLRNATTSSVQVDRNDLPWDGTTAYNLIVLFPSVQMYSGVVTSVAADVDATGLTIGTTIGLSSYDGDNTVTRAVVNGTDCPILQASAGTIVVTLPPGFTPAVGNAYVLYNTDVMLTATVSNVVSAANGTMLLTLGTPFPQAPPDFSTYFYGEPGTQKLARVTAIRRASEFRSTIEWIDYSAGCYVDSTPVVGETSAQITTNPGVTGLVANETFTLQSSGSYADFVVLTWKNGANTSGVGIYGATPGSNTKMLVRLTGAPTSWQMAVSPNVQWTFTVVGFDDNNDYAGFSSAPSVTFTAVGITTNLLKGSSFQSGFAYWNMLTRSGDTMIPTYTDDGEATYTVVGSALTVPQTLIQQVLSASLWAVGDLLMLSAYFETTGTPTGNLVADICFQNSSGTILSTARGVLTMAGAAANLTRVFCPLTAVPTGTTQVSVRVLVDGATLSIPVGATLIASHLLLEIGTAGQTEPSAWADIDVKGNVLDIFQTGSSSALRTQASTLPTFTGSFTYTSTATTITIAWASLAIAWPDGSYTLIQDSSIAITGLAASGSWYAYLYFDVINGGVKAATPTTAVGTPAILTVAQDGNANAACSYDGRVALTPSGMAVTTPASGSGGGSGGGRGGSPVKPISYY